LGGGVGAAVDLVCSFGETFDCERRTAEEMKFKCEIEKITTLKKGAKLILSIPEEETISVLKSIYNFIDKPVITEILIDTEKYKERMAQISEEQRKKIYALIRDIANYLGDSVESMKEVLKSEFIRGSQWDDFSLGNCSRELAGDFIDFLINFAFENGVPMSEHPLKRVDDIERYLAACLRHGVCCVCGQPGEIHHWDAIGMGRDRTSVDDSKNRKICLCRKHHTEAHQMGMDSFEQKYHAYGIAWEG